MPTYVRRRHSKRRPEPEEQPLYGPGSPHSGQPTRRAQPPSPAAKWTPRDLYARTADNRRVLILEALARQIVELECCKTKEEFNDLEQTLREVRRATWGQRPWSRATEPERFERHVLDMVRAFTGRPAIYPNRQRQPLAVVIDARPGADHTPRLADAEPDDGRTTDAA